jgi:probable FeS assembly SUF system protein SufT
MRSHEAVALHRDCEAVAIPNGNKVVLHAGDEVRITQSLGGSFTVTTEHGYMVRIAGKDADALGLEPAVQPSTDAAAAASTPEQVEKAVWDQLRTCYDPEIPVNIVDLGLVYHCQATPLPDGGHKVEVRFTLTAPGCGMAGSLQMDMESKILSLPGVKECDVDVVFDPPWSRDMMSEAARLDLGIS